MGYLLLFAEASADTAADYDNHTRNCRKHQGELSAQTRVGIGRAANIRENSNTNNARQHDEKEKHRRRHRCLRSTHAP